MALTLHQTQGDDGFLRHWSDGQGHDGDQGLACLGGEDQEAAEDVLVQ